MDGQVLGGGVIMLVAVLLWLVYLLPTWSSRRQYDAAERNAVRLNQALRVLAETSETPAEVRLELNARTAMAQQRLARQALAERESAALEHAKVDLERARTDRVTSEAHAKVELERARGERAAAEASARAEVAAAQAAARAEIAAARSMPSARRARARRWFRFAATLIGIAGLALAGWGAVLVVNTGAQLWLWAGVAVAAASAVVLSRLSRVAARAAVRVAEPVARPAVRVQDVELEQASRAWAPRELPRPLTASAGSRAAAVLEAEAARDSVRQAAREEAMRELAEAQRPPSIDTARVARAEGSAGAAGADFARMGYVDDAEIEAHVRGLLARRAVGE
ncbi:UNVERIFIED_CONTAM: large exoprotein [Microbacterium sp. SLM126]